MATASYSNAASKTVIYWVDIRGYFDFYESPSFEEIQQAVKQAYPDDPKVILKKMTGSLAGLFQVISLTQPIGDIYLKRISDEGVEESVQVPLTSSGPSRRSRDDDLLITIVEADMGDASSINGSVFDKAFAAYGDVVVNTKPQKYRESTLFNGNRLVVLNRPKDANFKKIPDRLELEGHRFLLKYKGKEWFCTSCNTTHIGPCSYLREFYALRDQREQLKIKTSIVSDSTLRHVESAGLTADVACMPGASVGQLVRPILRNSKDSQYSSIIIAAGANDTRSSSLDEVDVIKRIDLSLKRVTSLVEKKDDKTFTFLDTTPPIEGETSPTEFVTRTYFKRKVKTIATRFDNLEYVGVDAYPEPWQKGHPTVACTEKMLKVLSLTHKDLILSEKFATTPRLYNGVGGIWLSSCTGCGSRGRYASGGFCSGCIDIMDKMDIRDNHLYFEIKDLVLEEYPAGQKRSRADAAISSSDDNSPNGSKYSCH